MSPRLLKLTRMGSRRIQLARWLDASSRRPRGCVSQTAENRSRHREVRDSAAITSL
jgi:hypothetical protein